MLLHLFDVTQTALGRRVATVCEAMNKNLRGLQAVFLRLSQDAVQMLQHAVHATVGNNSHHMQFRRGRCFHAGHGRMPHGITGELFFGKQLVQTHQFLVHDPARADVFVTHFRVAHLAIWQTDVQAAGRDQRMRIFHLQGVVAGLFGEKNRVKFIL